MSFFARAVCIAIKDFPVCNAQIEGENMLLFKYVDMGIAVSTPKGLMVPVIRNTEALSFPEFDLKLEELATKARNNKITIDEMTGGTFTITNGGVFGSMLSTPILNPPQCAILGMHNIVDRPVALEGKVVIRPVMYVALSYDHRIIDGKESVGFLIKIKEAIENPLLLFGGLSPAEALLK
jgi:2-oxoglutarate dehydrogenase E2 component (dihydrolipoamide succinyltransferase)